jgi:hypothetical protein
VGIPGMARIGALQPATASPRNASTSPRVHMSRRSFISGAYNVSTRLPQSSQATAVNPQESGLRLLATGHCSPQ